MIYKFRQIIIILLALLILFMLFVFRWLREGFESSIPLHIYQTWHNKELDTKMQECVDTLILLNSEFEHHLYDDSDCADFIKHNFDVDVYLSYNSLLPGAYKADLWRYCVLYKNGGIYIDIKYCNTYDFKLISLTDSEYFVKDIDENGGGVYNAFMVCKPGNKKLLTCINNIVDNVKNKYYGQSDLEPTGPLLLKKEFTDTEIKNMRLSLGEKDCPTKTCINLDGKPILSIYKEYYETRKENKKDYHELWKNKQVYL